MLLVFIYVVFVLTDSIHRSEALTRHS